MELFPLPFEKVLNWPFYDFINVIDDVLTRAGRLATHSIKRKAVRRHSATKEVTLRR
jgi:hypothetical protein